MLFSRTSAFIAAFAIIIAVAFVAITVTQNLGTSINHNAAVQHDDGVILKMDQNLNLVLKDSKGQLVQFRCADHCLLSRAHIQRHINERAHTDVYYVRMPDATLVAVDVD